MRLLATLLYLLLPAAAFGQASPPLYPFPPNTNITPITGPVSSVVGDLVLWNNTLGTIVKDAPLSSLNLPAPPITICAANAFVISYPTLGSSLVCRRPATTDLSDITGFSVNTSGTITAGSISSTTGPISSATSVTSLSLGFVLTDTILNRKWTLSASNDVVTLFDGALSVFKIDSIGIPTVASIVNGTQPIFTSWNGPPGSHSTVQEWLMFRGAKGVVRYVPGY